MIYVVITFVVLLILNIYCSNISQSLFNQSKESSMIQKCQLAADEIATLEVINSSTVGSIIGQMESLKSSRMIVTNQSGATLYDSIDPLPKRWAMKLSRTARSILLPMRLV